MAQTQDATSASGGTRKPRRKWWGWLFLVLFVLQLALFTVLVVGTINDIERTRGVRQAFIDAKRSGEDLINFMGSKILEMNKQLYWMIGIGLVSTAVTLTGTVLGLRRR